jgi:hypothetical protein
MASLLSAAITTAAANVVGPAKRFRRQTMDLPRAILCQSNFVYGSGGTSGAFYVQTSIDGGASWCDVFSFAVTTSSLRQFLCITAAKAITTAVAATDGTLAAGAADGLVGDLWRVKYTTVGTYGGNTSIAIDLGPGNLVPAANE